MGDAKRGQGQNSGFRVAKGRDDMKIKLLISYMVTAVVVAGIGISPTASVAAIWGRIANLGFANQRIKATLFFAGQALDGTNPYGCNPGSNLDAYTMHPRDFNKRWSENRANRDMALNQMVKAGVNVINMSSWGEDFLPCAWAIKAAPMQTSPTAHDELFAATVGKPLLIAPFLEERGDGSLFPWAFRGEFPIRRDGQVAPGTVSQIVNLINRYLKNPRHPEWAEKWARVYDQDGNQRYAVVIIHASSDLLSSGQDADFAAGFDKVAKAVFDQTGGIDGGIKIGFFIDALPPGTTAPGAFKPSAKFTGPELRKTKSLLGIECFIPEVFFGSSDTGAVVNWKRHFSSGWFQTGIPFLMDVSPGYDGHIVFGKSPPVYGLTPEWLSQLGQMVSDYGQAGMVFNAWNGYTESLAAVPLLDAKYGNLFYDWLRSLQPGKYGWPFILGPYILN